MGENYVKLGSWKTGIGIVLFLSLFTTNPIATFFALLYIPLSVKLLWRKGEPPVIFFALLMQWSQVCIKVLYANILKIDFSRLFIYYDGIYQAYAYSLAALYVINLGVYLVLRKKEVFDFEDFKVILKKYSPKKLRLVYLLAIFFFPSIIFLSYLVPGLQQVFYKILDLKWAIFFIFFSRFFLLDEDKKMLLIIIVLEVLISFTGYFSSFKDIFFIIGIAYIFLKRSFNIKNYLTILSIGILLFNLMVIWQFVKPQYRSYLSAGQNEQAVTVSKVDALKKLYELSGNTRDMKYEDAVTTLLDRMAYIDIFSASISYIPKNKPHENGSLWFDAVSRVFMPRFLFPGKSVVDDTEKTIRYTGLHYAGSESGTSISLGYVAESYIDLGFPLMLVPLLLWGMLIGYIYQFIIKNSYNIVWGYGICFSLIFQINLFETSLDKVFSSLVYFFLVFILINKYVIRRVDFYLSN